jgi:tyrosyl-tRNA synthetase
MRLVCILVGHDSIGPLMDPAQRSSAHQDDPLEGHVTADRPPPRFPPGLPGLLDELRWRGLLHAATPGLEARLASGRPIAGYNGFDPSGPSLHVGHLIPIMGLLHLQRRGGRPVVVLGGATGMIGDPSGRSAERNLLDDQTIAAHAAALRRQFEGLLDFSPGPGGALMVNNLDWLGPLRVLDFLRDVGKHFTIPYMLAKDSVQLRLERGLSYTEFSYMLLQAVDFLHLYRTHGVELQMGGADQWGNITAGLELIRRVEAPGAGESPAHGIAYPLLTGSGGEKFGKTAQGTSVWLAAERTTPYAFYQFWMNTPDAEVGRYLRFFTLLDPEEIVALEQEQRRRPEERPGQRRLALDVTARIHGEAMARHVAAVSEAVFSGQPIRDPAILETLHREVDGFQLRANELGDGLLDLLVRSGTVASRGEARRLVAQGGISVNDVRIVDPGAPLPPPVAGEWIVLRIGKKRLRVGRVLPAP